MDFKNFDLVTPDGAITNLNRISEKKAEATIFIENIQPNFVGFSIEKERIFFNLKSTLAQLGLNAQTLSIELDKSKRCAQILLELATIGKLSIELLKYLQVGAFIGKLFAADERRRVRDPDYLGRMFGRSDRWGRPLLSLGGLHGGKDLILEKVDGRTVAYLSLLNGKIDYEESIHGFLPTVAKSLNAKQPIRELLRLHQIWKPYIPRNVAEDELLLVELCLCISELFSAGLSMISYHMGITILLLLSSSRILKPPATSTNYMEIVCESLQIYRLNFILWNLIESMFSFQIGTASKLALKTAILFLKPLRQPQPLLNSAHLFL